FRGEWPRTLLTMLGVALGVAVFVSIRLAHRSALTSFAATVDAVAGRSDLEITGCGEGFDERLYSRIRQLPGVRAAAPTIEVWTLAEARSPGTPAHGGTSAGPGASRTAEAHPSARLLMLGVDLLAEGPFARG